MASGKSTVRRLLAAAGFETVDADELVAELYRPGGEGVTAVRSLFGDGCLTAEGAVDHRAVAELVFARPQARRELEAAIHPLVRRRFAELAGRAHRENSRAVVVLEATLLVEAGYGPDFDLVVTVEADDDVRIRRAVARGASEADARARLAAQGDGDERRRGAQRVIRNDGDLEALRCEVERLVADIRRLARERVPHGDSQGGEEE